MIYKVEKSVMHAVHPHKKNLVRNSIGPKTNLLFWLIVTYLEELVVKNKAKQNFNTFFNTFSVGCFINVESSTSNLHVRSCSSFSKEDQEKYGSGWGCGRKMQKTCHCKKNECNLNVETASVGLRLEARVTPLLIILFILCRIL
jgi:hypothetical protein